MAQYVNSQIKALDKSNGLPLQDEIARVMRTRQLPEEFGSGNGIVMV